MPDLPPHFAAKSLANPDGTVSEYVVFVPPKLAPKPPVVLFLHGAGESKGSKRTPIEQGIGNGYLTLRAKTFPAIVVFPQAEALDVPADERWGPNAPDGKRALAALDAVVAQYKCDPKRVYLTGLAAGGTGVWSLAAAFPEKWAAIAPITGAGNPGTAKLIKAVPCWCFHGERDPVYSVQKSRVMVAALKEAGGKPAYTEFKNFGHGGVWDKVYESDEFYKWLFAQRRK